MNATQPTAVIVLAAGAGTRMRSKTPKVLHRIGGKSLLGHALAAAEGANAKHTVTVVRHKRELVEAEALACAPQSVIAPQDEIPGTGRAVQCGIDALEAAHPGQSGTVLVTAGDVPLLRPETLTALVADHSASGAAVTVLTTSLQDPARYGRIVRGEDGEVQAIVEYRDATEQQRAITEINSGVYAFDLEFLRRTLPALGTQNDQGEVYLTDTIAAARGEGRAARALVLADPSEVEGCNDRAELAHLASLLNQRILHHLMAEVGVSIIDPGTTWIDSDVVVENDATILPGTQLHGKTVIGEGATVGPDSTLTDVTVGPGATVCRVYGIQSEIGAGANVGPYSYLRPGTKLGAGGKIGGFVETKNVVIGEESKVPHLTYVGDAEIGRGTNIGAASVFVNYDGVNKHRTVIGDHCRTGSDNLFVAPVNVGDGVYTGAGTVVRQDIPSGALSVNDTRQRILEGWVEENRPGTAAAEAAKRARK